MKFAVCAILKNENLYLREWVEHHISLGFDKIILYDNNDINGEIPNIVIQDYIRQGMIDIYNYRGKKVKLEQGEWECKIQTAAYNECLEKYENEYNWIAFIDIDEFIEIEEYKKIQYLFDSRSDYNNFDGIVISSYMIGDDSKLYYENKPVKERFKLKQNFIDKQLNIELNNMIKCIVNTKTTNRFTESDPHHIISDNLCNVYGIKISLSTPVISLNAPNHQVMYFKHYYTKSLTEFLYKVYNFSWSDIAKNRKLDIYKTGNKWTEEHEKVYQNFLKTNNITL